MEYWIIPCNLKRFDVVEHFKQSNQVVWRNSFSIHKGDIVYIYLSAPYSEIRYRCNVISDVVDDEIVQKNAYAIPPKQTKNYYSKKIKYIILELDKTYPELCLPLHLLKENGLGQTQIQARVGRQLRSFFTKFEDNVSK